MKKRFLIFILMLIFATFSAYAKEKIEVINDTVGIYIFKIDTKKYGSKIKPYIADKLTTAQKIYEDECFDFVVNGGFFDVKTGKSVSYVTIDNKMVSNVEDNIKLINELERQNRLQNVLQRSEFRILEDKKGELKFDIALHNAPIKKNYILKHALQAGPMITPTMDLVKEGFVIKENDVVKSQSVDILKRRERTALGLKGKYLYIILFTNNYKVDAFEMKDYMEKTLKLKKAMALDGGLSTSANYKDISISSFGKHQRRVKSFLVIER